MKNSGIKKIIGLVAGITAVLSMNFVVLAQQDMTVYITDSGGCYHLDGCPQIKKTKIAMMLSDTPGRFDPCTVCGAPSNVDVDPNDVAEPQSVAVTNTETESEGEISGEQVDEGDFYIDSDTETQEDADSRPSESASGDASDESRDDSSSNEDRERVSVVDVEEDDTDEIEDSGSEIATEAEVEDFYKKHPEKDKTGRYTSKADSKEDKNSSTGNSTSSGNNSSASGNSSNSNSSGGRSSSGASYKKDPSELMSQAQRRSKYGSKTNPKKGEKPATTPKPAVNGYLYADFATFNSYDSENHLGGTPIYIIGTVTDVAAFIQNTNQYRVGVMLTDSDGYQWYLRMWVSKSKFEDFKTAIKGQTGCFYGGYAGYSGVLTRPMMDITVFQNAATGASVDLSPYVL